MINEKSLLFRGSKNPARLALKVSATFVHLGVVHNCQHLSILVQLKGTNLGEEGGLRQASVLFLKC